MSVYKIVELVGTSPNNWHEAAANAVQQASTTLRNLRVAEISELDIALDDSDPPVMTYRAKVKLSLKYEGS